MRRAFGLLFAVLLFTTAVHAKTEAEWQAELCPSPLFEREVILDDGSRADCISSSVAVEIDFSDKWAEAIGQALLYAELTGKLPVIFLVCRSRIETCDIHAGRIAAVARRYALPLTVVRIGP